MTKKTFGERMKEVKAQKERDLNDPQLKQIKLDQIIEKVRQSIK